MHEHRVVTEGGHRLHVEELAPGPDPVIVLLHGFGASSTTWAPLVPALVATGRRVVAFDRLGFGRSDRPRRPADGPPAFVAAEVPAAAHLVHEEQPEAVTAALAPLWS